MLIKSLILSDINIVSTALITSPLGKPGDAHPRSNLLIFNSNYLQNTTHDFFASEQSKQSMATRIARE